MSETEMPSMETLATLVDQLQEIAADELPGAKTCHVRLFDDGTYRITFEHRYGDDERVGIVYDRETGEVYWRDTAGARTMHIEDPVYPAMIVTTYFKDDAERVVTTIEPPIKCDEQSIECTETVDVFLANRGNSDTD